MTNKYPKLNLPTIAIHEYQQRRQQLMQSLDSDSVALVSSATLQVRNNGVHYPYRQDSDFLYLTGFSEPESVLVLIPDEHKSVLFCRSHDAVAEMWNGAYLGPEEATAMLGVDCAYPSSSFATKLTEILEGKQKIYCSLGKNSSFEVQIRDWVENIHPRQSTKPTPDEYISITRDLHELRLCKSQAELNIMRQAASITVAAHKRAMRTCKAGMLEMQLEAELIHEFCRHGSRYPAYESIVAGGNNACILHYTENNKPLQSDNLVLIDAGCEYANYAADVTSTFPVNGVFTSAQRTLYNLVLASQKAAIDQARAGLPFNRMHDAAVSVITEGLLDLGLLQGELNELIETNSYTKFYPHKTGHWLGIDVHDVGQYHIEGNARPLQEGMVVTVEPGIYVPLSCTEVEDRWRGIGIRIEDDIVVTAAAPENISSDLPRTTEEIEQWIRD